MYLKQLLQEVLNARYKDKDRYTVSVVAYPKSKRLKGTGIQGFITITSPTGEMVDSGFWMDYPEKGWKYKNKDLTKDYADHWKEGTEEQSIWRSEVPIQKRLDMEAKQQATAYKPLKQQFLNKKQKNKNWWKN